MGEFHPCVRCDLPASTLRVRAILKFRLPQTGRVMDEQQICRLLRVFPGL